MTKFGRITKSVLSQSIIICTWLVGGCDFTGCDHLTGYESTSYESTGYDYLTDYE